MGLNRNCFTFNVSGISCNYCRKLPFILRMTHRHHSLVKCLDLTPKDSVVIGKRRILWTLTTDSKEKFENFESCEEKCLQYTKSACNLPTVYCIFIFVCVWFFVMPRLNTLPLIGSGSIRCRFMLSLFWKNPHWERFCHNISVFPWQEHSFIYHRCYLVLVTDSVFEQNNINLDLTFSNKYWHKRL